MDRSNLSKEVLAIFNLDSIKDYRGLHPEPHDFQKFWHNEMLTLQYFKPSLTITEKKKLLPDIFAADGYFESFDNTKISLRYVAPADNCTDAPGLLIFHGYTQHKPDYFLMLPYVLAGFHVMAIDCRDQGGGTFENGPVMRGNIIRGITEGPSSLYMRKNYLDAVLAFRLLKSLNYINPGKVGVSGGSQGGTLSLVTAALDSDVAFAAVSSPFLSDFKMIKKLNLDIDVYEELGWYYKMFDPQHKNEDAFHDTLGYIDLKNFTPMVSAPVLWLMGLKDPTCPPATQMAAYNGLSGSKQLEIYPDATHELFPGRYHHVADQLFDFIMNFR